MQAAPALAACHPSGPMTDPHPHAKVQLGAVTHLQLTRAPLLAAGTGYDTLVRRPVASRTTGAGVLSTQLGGGKLLHTCSVRSISFNEQLEMRPVT